jgi:ElaB/YqjD/DUF883 family membrane-anchored ribosome-binding protein
MSRLLQYVLSICALAVTGALLILCLHITHAVDAWGAAAVNLQPTLDAISGPRGTLHEVNKAVVKIGDAIVTTQMQERRITPATLAAVNSLATIAPHVNAVMDSATRTADAATETLHSASGTLQTVNEKAGPMLEAYTGAAKDLDSVIRDNASSLHTFSLHAAGITTNLDDVTFDFARVTRKASDDYLKPRTPWQKIGHGLWNAYDITAFGARHVP